MRSATSAKTSKFPAEEDRMSAVPVPNARAPANYPTAKGEVYSEDR
jgi:hypothetical protein